MEVVLICGTCMNGQPTANKDMSRERLSCVQVTGDDHVPAGRHTWHAAAAPMKRPWGTAEAALVDLQGQLLEQQAGAEGAMEAHKTVIAAT